VNSIAFNQGQDANIGNQSLYLHIALYAFSLFGELNELSRQYRNNKFKVFYFSKGVNNIELFVEFIFEILHEKAEPLIFGFEGLKAVLKLLEYHKLTKMEKLHSYIPLESYREMMLLQEIRENHIKHMRQKRLV